MAGFTSNFQTFKPSSSSFIDLDQHMDLLNQFSAVYENQNMNNPQSFMGFSNENLFFPQQLILQPDQHQFLQGFQPVFQQEEQKNVVAFPQPLSSNGNGNGNGKRKAMDVSASSSGDSSSVKRVKGNIEKGEVQKEVVHVRARRGQATDSHSLAERVRRGKINERLRCLQDMVPGCYKAMGMAVMLDEIINYVQSLQNQVEFLSMKLTEASRFHNLDSDAVSLEALLRAKAIEGEKVQRIEEREGGFTQNG